jgi:hypothetical protein
MNAKRREGHFLFGTTALEPIERPFRLAQADVHHGKACRGDVALAGARHSDRRKRAVGNATLVGLPCRLANCWSTRCATCSIRPTVELDSAPGHGLRAALGKAGEEGPVPSFVIAPRRLLNVPPF